MWRELKVERGIKFYKVLTILFKHLKKTIPESNTILDFLILGVKKLSFICKPVLIVLLLVVETILFNTEGSVHAERKS